MSQEETILHESEEVSEEVIQKHIQGLKNKKATNIFRVTVEYLKLSLSQELRTIPTALINKDLH